MSALPDTTIRPRRSGHKASSVCVTLFRGMSAEFVTALAGFCDYNFRPHPSKTLWNSAQLRSRTIYLGKRARLLTIWNALAPARGQDTLAIDNIVDCHAILPFWPLRCL